MGRSDISYITVRMPDHAGDVAVISLVLGDGSTVTKREWTMDNDVDVVMFQQHLVRMVMNVLLPRVESWRGY